jgi:hypothetical protein
MTSGPHGSIGVPGPTGPSLSQEEREKLYAELQRYAPKPYKPRIKTNVWLWLSFACGAAVILLSLCRCAGPETKPVPTAKSCPGVENPSEWLLEHNCSTLQDADSDEAKQ